MCAGSEDTAQDLVQEALIRGYEAFLADRFMPGTNARAWLLRILTNLFINHYNRSKKWEASVDAEAAAEAVGARTTAGTSDGQPERSLLESTLDEPLERALSALPDEFRLCVVLVDIEGLEYAEAAAIAGVPIGTVRSRLSRARLQLHKALYDYACNLRRAG